MSLTTLGWNAYFAAMWESLDREDGWMAARVVSQQRGLWRIAGDFGAGSFGAHDLGAQGSGECWAAPSGKMHATSEVHGDWPAVGDWIAAAISDGDQRSTIHGVLPRRSQFVRKTAGKRIEQQVIAANVDTAFLVVALDGDLNLRRLERYLAQCWESGAKPVILLNKADECRDFAESAAATERIARGTPVLVLSARTRQGVEALDPFLAAGQTVVLLGSSGVGKSTLVNLLLGQDVQAVQPTRGSDSKGRHTTTTRQLVSLPCGAMVIDTPGLRKLQLWDAVDALSETFADIDALAAECRFRDCRHENEPGCVVQAALHAGTLDAARLENRRKLEREQDFLRRKMDPEARKEAHDRIKVSMRGVRQMYRQRDKDGGKAMTALVLDLALARRIELAEARAAVDGAETFARLQPGGRAAVERIAGGYAIYCGANSPVTQAIGLGLDGAVSEEEFDQLESFYRNRGEPVRVETCPLADASLIEHFGKRKYRVTEFSNVMARPLCGADFPNTKFDLPGGISIEKIGTERIDLWTLTVSQGFAENFPVTQEILGVTRMFAFGPTVECYLARLDGAVAGGATLALREGVAGLFGASTLPAFRNRGVQTALLDVRLARAAAAHCDLAVCLAQPGSASQRNVMRKGFSVLYTRVKFERELAPA